MLNTLLTYGLAAVALTEDAQADSLYVAGSQDVNRRRIGGFWRPSESSESSESKNVDGARPSWRQQSSSQDDIVQQFFATFGTDFCNWPGFQILCYGQAAPSPAFYPGPSVGRRLDEERLLAPGREDTKEQRRLKEEESVLDQQASLLGGEEQSRMIEDRRRLHLPPYTDEEILQKLSAMFGPDICNWPGFQILCHAGMLGARRLSDEEQSRMIFSGSEDRRRLHLPPYTDEEILQKLAAMFGPDICNWPGFQILCSGRRMEEARRPADERRLASSADERRLASDVFEMQAPDQENSNDTL